MQMGLRLEGICEYTLCKCGTLKSLARAFPTGTERISLESMKSEVLKFESLNSVS